MSKIAYLLVSGALAFGGSVAHAQMFNPYHCMQPKDDAEKEICLIAKELNVPVPTAYAGSALSSITQIADSCKFRLTTDFIKMKAEMLADESVKKVYDYNVQMTDQYGTAYFKQLDNGECEARYKKAGPSAGSNEPQFFQ